MPTEVKSPKLDTLPFVVRASQAVEWVDVATKVEQGKQTVEEALDQLEEEVVSSSCSAVRVMCEDGGAALGSTAGACVGKIFGPTGEKIGKKVGEVVGRAIGGAVADIVEKGARKIASEAKKVLGAAVDRVKAAGNAVLSFFGF